MYIRLLVLLLFALLFSYYYYLIKLFFYLYIFIFRFFLEMLHNQKSTKLEWVIILLIGTEIIINVAALASAHFF